MIGLCTKVIHFGRVQSGSVSKPKMRLNFQKLPNRMKAPPHV